MSNDATQRSHADMTTVSIIRLPLWDAADWMGAAFLTTVPPSKEPPVLGLVFRNAEIGTEIFAHWRAELGEEDANKGLRVVIIRGIDASHPHHYKIVIGSNWSDVTNGKFFTMVSRMHRMAPETSENLDRFLSALGSAGSCYLAPARTRALAEGDTVAFASSFRVKLSEVHVRQAWEIGPNDPDCVAIDGDTEPCLPKGMKNAPVLALLKARGKRRRRWR